MKLSKDFRMPAPVERAWEVLSDVTRIVPCIPGAELHAWNGEELQGALRVRIEPLTVQYRGEAQLKARDAANRRVVLEARGEDTSGRGSGRATFTALVGPEGDDTRVSIEVDVEVSGEVASVGEQALIDAGEHLLNHFVDCVLADALGRSESAPPEGDWFEVEQTVVPIEERADHARLSSERRESLKKPLSSSVSGVIALSELTKPEAARTSGLAGHGTPPRVGVGADVGVAGEVSPHLTTASPEPTNLAPGGASGGAGKGKRAERGPARGAFGLSARRVMSMLALVGMLWWILRRRTSA